MSARNELVSPPAPRVETETSYTIVLDYVGICSRQGLGSYWSQIRLGEHMSFLSFDNATSPGKLSRQDTYIRIEGKGEDNEALR